VDLGPGLARYLNEVGKPVTICDRKQETRARFSDVTRLKLPEHDGIVLDIGHERQEFVDDLIIELVENMRTWHQPAKTVENPCYRQRSAMGAHRLPHLQRITGV
jgi:thioredoxin reductase